jgi:uncharacterized protein YjbI with pentapeptide repeats
MNISDFLTAMENNRITGEFDLGKHNDELMDRDFESVVFKNCVLVGGNFVSVTFKDCSFENCVFESGSLAGVSFINCFFKNRVRFNVQQASFTIS